MSCVFFILWICFNFLLSLLFRLFWRQLKCLVRRIRWVPQAIRAWLEQDQYDLGPCHGLYSTAAWIHHLECASLRVLAGLHLARLCYCDKIHLWAYFYRDVFEPSDVMEPHILFLRSHRSCLEIQALLLLNNRRSLHTCLGKFHCAQVGRLTERCPSRDIPYNLHLLECRSQLKRRQFWCHQAWVPKIADVGHRAIRLGPWIYFRPSLQARSRTTRLDSETSTRKRHSFQAILIAWDHQRGELLQVLQTKGKPCQWVHRNFHWRHHDWQPFQMSSLKVQAKTWGLLGSPSWPGHLRNTPRWIRFQIRCQPNFFCHQQAQRNLETHQGRSRRLRGPYPYLRFPI